MRSLNFALLCAFLATNVHAASTNYEKLVENADSSITIIKPQFRDQNGKNILLSTDSDVNGVCVYYGLSSALEDGAVESRHSTEQTAVINSASQLSGYRGSSTRFNPSIQSITCRNKNSHSRTRHPGTLYPIDAHHTLVSSPKFLHGQAQTPIYVKSDLDGVCRLFGFERAIPNSVRPIERYYGWVADITRDSRFAGYVEGGFNDDTVQRNITIDTLICVGRSHSVPFKNHVLPVNHERCQRAAFSPTDDGNTFVSWPKFGPKENGTGISSESNPDGVCRLFGLKAALPGSVRRVDTYADYLTVIDGGAHFVGFEKLKKKPNYAIQNLICIGKIVEKADFTDQLTLDNIETVLRLIAEQMYPQRKEFLSGVAAQVKRTSEMSAPDHERVSARMFVFVALEPFIQDIQSSWFKTTIAPIWNRDTHDLLDSARIRTIRDIPASPSTARQALSLLHEGFGTLKTTLSSHSDQKAIESIQMALGIAISSTLQPKDAKVAEAMSLLETHSDILTRFQIDARTAPIAKSMGIVIEYLKQNY